MHRRISSSTRVRNYQSVVGKAISKRREMYCMSSAVAVVFDDSFEAHCNNKWLPFAIHELVENSDMCIFVTNQEAGDVRKFITGADAGEESVLDCHRE